MKHVRQRKSVLHKLLRTLAFPGAGESYFKKGTIKCDTLPSLFQILETIRHTIDFSTVFSNFSHGQVKENQSAPLKRAPLNLNTAKFESYSPWKLAKIREVTDVCFLSGPHDKSKP